MKRVALRLASAALATAICFGASARAHVPGSDAPVTAKTNTRVAAPVVTTVVGTVSVASATIIRTVTRVSVTHSLEHADPVAQFDVTK